MAAGYATYQICFPDKEDDCKRIIAQIWEAMNMIEGRLADLYIDKYDLYNKARSAPSPSLPKGTGSWNGHVTQLIGWQNRLRNLIDEAIKKGCKVPPNAWNLAYADIPKRPLR